MNRYRGGYDARPPLVGPTVAEGDAQRLAASTTSATVTVGAASGGGGAYTYSAPAIDRPGGSSAAVSGTAPGALSVSGLVDGEAVVVSGTVTDDGTGQSAEWSTTVAVEASGGGGGGRSWQVYKDFDLENGVSQGPYTAGSGTNYVLTDGAWSLTVNLKSGSNNGTMELVNGEGLKVEGVNSTGGVVGLAFLLSEQMLDLDYEWLCENPLCVQVVVDDYDIQSDDFSGFIVGINNTTSYTSGKLRSLFFQARTGSSTEQRSIRTNGSNTGIADLPSLPPSQRRMDFVLTDGDRMSANVYDGVGEADPAVDFFDLSGNFLQCGSWGLSRNTSSTVYTTNMRLVFGVVQKMRCTIKAIRILQYKAAP